MNKYEKYLSIKRTIREAEDISIVFCSSDGPNISYNRPVENQEYTISFSSSGRGRLLDVDIVRKALTENLKRITESICHFAQHDIYEAEKEALQEAEDALESIKQEIKL